VKGNKQLEEIYKHEAKTWRYRYGEELVAKMSADVREAGHGRWRQLLKEWLELLRFSPQVFAEHAKRKLLTSAFGIKQ